MTYVNSKREMQPKIKHRIFFEQKFLDLLTACAPGCTCTVGMGRLLRGSGSNGFALMASCATLEHFFVLLNTNYTLDTSVSQVIADTSNAIQ